MKIVMIRQPAGAYLRHCHMTEKGIEFNKKKWRRYKNGTVGASCRKCNTRFLLTKSSKTDEAMILN